MLYNVDYQDIDNIQRMTVYTQQTQFYRCHCMLRRSSRGFIYTIEEKETLANVEKNETVL